MTVEYICNIMSKDHRTGRGDLKKMKLTNKGARRLNETTVMEHV